MLVRNPIRAAQTELGLVGRDALFATLLDVSDDALQRAKDGDSEARDAVVRAASLVLGIEPHELLFDGPEGRATTALLKTVIDPLHASAFEEAAHQGLQRDLGRFVRRLRRKAWLRAALGDAPLSLPPALAALVRPTPPETNRTWGADALARRVREALGLGDAPIRSMVALVRDALSIELHTTRSMWGQVAGASYACGDARGILVNLRERPKRRGVRMTLAHELCHVLFDGAFVGARHNGMLAFSPGGESATARPRGAGSVDPAEAFRLWEQRANAFAAYLLAPSRGVEALFPQGDPAKSPGTVDMVAEHFGLSRLAALNVAKNVFRWSKSDRLRVLELLADAQALDDAPWAADALTDTPAEDAEHHALADRAVAAGRMLPVERDLQVCE
jgi:Zn-dependent peptidase ImmA (M78 family)